MADPLHQTTAGLWRPVHGRMIDEPVLFFSPDDAGNVPGGMIWVSGGKSVGGWRNDYAKNAPTLFIPLREIAPHG